MKYFKADKEWQYNSRICKYGNKWSTYAEGYQIASELIEKQICKMDRSNQDFLIYPYCYLIRHFIEIKLKEIIFEANNAINNPVNPSKGMHDLSTLWKMSQETLNEVWQDSFEVAPKEVFDFINELHSIDLISDNFRYPINKEERETLSNIDEINFKKLATAFRAVKQYLNGITDVLEVAKDERFT